MISALDNEYLHLSLHLLADESKAEQQDGLCSCTKHVCNMTNLVYHECDDGDGEYDDNNCYDDDIVGYDDVMMNNYPITTTHLTLVTIVVMMIMKMIMIIALMI